MFIPPYFPEPIEVPDNVAGRSYDDRLRFIRFVTLLFALAGALAMASATRAPLLNLAQSVIAFILALMIHQTLRAALGGTKLEAVLQMVALPMTILATGGLARHLVELGWPVFALAIALAGAALYTLMAGRDFSFVGQYVLAGLFTILGTIATAYWAPTLISNVMGGILLGLAGLAYLVYDFAMILKRRRLDEKLSSIADLHGDLLNGLTYPIRVLVHWRKFNI